MCLEVVYRGKQKREALAKLPDEFPVWKVLECTDEGGWKTGWVGTAVFAGEHRAEYLGSMDCSAGNYRAGWHAMLTKKGAATWGVQVLSGDLPVVRCKGKKCHVRTIGEQSGHVCVVFSHITFPKKCGKPPKKK